MLRIAIVTYLAVSHAFFLSPGLHCSSSLGCNSHTQARKASLAKDATSRTRSSSILRRADDLTSLCSTASYDTEEGSSGQVLDAVVVGGGISGCTAAYYLQQRGVNCVLAEARDELGGNIITKSGNIVSVLSSATVYV